MNNYNESTYEGALIPKMDTDKIKLFAPSYVDLLYE